MSLCKNSLGQPIGEPVLNWLPVAPPPRTIMDGDFCRVEPIDVDRHGADLFAAFSADKENWIWTYQPYGPFHSEPNLRAWIVETCLGDDPLFHAIVDKRSDKALGVTSYLRINRAVGVIEIGHITYSPFLQHTQAATEAIYLMMRRIFSELGYRRCEWKCDALNAPSRRAAERLGFGFDGVFRQATIYKGRNRDTAWFSILDKEWPVLEEAYLNWLSPENFGTKGQQKSRLSAEISRRRKHAFGD